MYYYYCLKCREPMKEIHKDMCLCVCVCNVHIYFRFSISLVTSYLLFFFVNNFLCFLLLLFHVRILYERKNLRFVVRRSLYTFSGIVYYQFFVFFCCSFSFNPFYYTFRLNVSYLFRVLFSPFCMCL